MEMQIDTQNETQLLEFFKALVDVERLKLVGLLAVEPRTASELAEVVKLKPARVANHLGYLVHAGLVSRDGPSFRLNTEAIQKLARQVLAHSKPAINPDELEGDEFNRKVLEAFVKPDGTIKSLPMQQKKLLVVLRHILPAFEYGVQYPEKQVNEILRKVYEDPASLRRYLVDCGMLALQNGVYWRI